MAKLQHPLCQYCMSQGQLHYLWWSNQPGLIFAYVMEETKSAFARLPFLSHGVAETSFVSSQMVQVLPRHMGAVRASGCSKHPPQIRLLLLFPNRPSPDHTPSRLSAAYLSCT
jgi:hypothetical protein